MGIFYHSVPLGFGMVTVLLVVMLALGVWQARVEAREDAERDED